jgi:Retroviral aspartyl protease
MLSSRLFDNIRNSGAIKRHHNCSYGLTSFSADISPMKVITTSDVEIRIQGIKFEITCCVIENLALYLILGLDFLKRTQASIDIETDQLILRKAKLTVQLVGAVQRHTRHSAGTNVQSKQVTTIKKQRQWQSTIASIITGERWEPEEPIKIKKLPTLAEIRKDLQEKGFKFKKSSLVGQDLNKLITFILINKDIYHCNTNKIQRSRWLTDVAVLCGCRRRAAISTA